MGKSTLSVQDIVEPHHHFYDTNLKVYSFLKSLGATEYLPEQFTVAMGNLPVHRSIHIEAMPDDGLGEVEWLEELVRGGRAPTLAGIVASCDLAHPEVEARLAQLLTASSKVRGIRYMLDYEGPFDGRNATHIACSRHNKDYLRDINGAAQDFERGFALLAKYNLSFDLQCCPAQLEAAAALCARYPEVPVCIDHLGKVRHLAVDGSDADTAKLVEWRRGMRLMAALPHVYVKLSMLGYCVPGWHEDAQKESFLKDLVREVIALFGAGRCMFSSNWHHNGAVSNSDGIDVTGPDMEELFGKFFSWVNDMDAADQTCLFSGTASSFYRV
jgi:predicted TIM-barrel fold metal-dependent hydrolase